MAKLLFVCLGNICRSPMAEFVMKSVTNQHHIESRATSSWEHSNPIHAGTQAIFKKYQIPYDSHKSSQQISTSDFETFDYIIAMDDQNLRDLKKMAPSPFKDKIVSFANQPIPDPWYTGDFEQTYQLISQGCHDWQERLVN